MQMVLWSIVASSQFFLSGRASFLACRCLLGVLQGGFIPDAVLYLSYFYKSRELSIRLGFFWTAIVFADIFAAVSAYSLLHMRGVLGYSGWRWLFLVEVCLHQIRGGSCLLTSLLRGLGSSDIRIWDRVFRPHACRANSDCELVPWQERVVHSSVRPSYSEGRGERSTDRPAQGGNHYCEPGHPRRSVQGRHAQP